MEYYKILQNNAIIGAVTSKQFIRYTPITNCLVHCTKQQGEYLTYKDILYRASWMQPLVVDVNYIEAQILPIDQEEYDYLIEALRTKDEIVIEEPDEEHIPPEPIEEDASFIFIRETKLAEMSYTCRQTIESGIDIEIRGETHHFSLSTQDQLNLMNLNVMAQTQELIPYHADGETCVFYTAAEISQIFKAANDYKIYHTTYFNALKEYINALETIEEIAANTYGVEIPEEYKSEVLRVLE